MGFGVYNISTLLKKKNVDNALILSFLDSGN